VWAFVREKPIQRGNVVTFVHDDESVGGGDVFDTCPAGESRQERDVDNARGPG
jgi:hypothetical protein